VTTASISRYEQARADDARGLRYFESIGPKLPTLDATALMYLRDDLLARAACAEEQAAGALEVGSLGLLQRCEGIAGACREFAAQIARYCTDPAWQGQEELPIRLAPRL
jgi:hypothetical protein